MRRMRLLSLLGISALARGHCRCTCLGEDPAPCHRGAFQRPHADHFPERGQAVRSHPSRRRDQYRGCELGQSAAATGDRHRRRDAAGRLRDRHPLGARLCPERHRRAARQLHQAGISRPLLRESADARHRQAERPISCRSWPQPARSITTRIFTRRPASTSVPKTWDDLRAASEKVKANGDGAYGFGIQGKEIETDTYWYYPFWSYGGEIVENGKSGIASDAGVKAAELYKILHRCRP